MRPKEPDHVWVVERLCAYSWANWHSHGVYDSRVGARDAINTLKAIDTGTEYRIRKYIPVNRLSMEMVVR